MNELSFRPIELPYEALTAEWLLVWLTLLSILVAATVILMTAHAVRQQTVNSKIEKMADTLLECDRRYQRIKPEIMNVFPIVPVESATLSVDELKHNQKLEYLVRSYWALQYEQWEYFKLGLIPDSMFKAWMRARILCFSAKSTETLGGKSHRDSWESCKGDYQHVPDFIEYMTALVKLSDISPVPKVEFDKRFSELKSKALSEYKAFKKRLVKEYVG